MFENLGLGAILTFEQRQAVANMRQAEQRFGGLIGSAERLKRGMAGLAMGAGIFGASLIPLTATVGLGARTAMGFEQSLSAVAAVAQAPIGELNKLRQTAMSLSLQTQYTGTEVANAMETMARAGFSASETMQGLPGVLAAAAAEQMPVAEAADIVSIAIRGMGAAAFGANKTLTQQTSHVADALAVVSAKSITSMSALGESFTYVAGQAAMSGLSFDETAAALGVMADKGQKGSMAGTQLQQMLLHLARPSKQAMDLFAKMGISQADLNVETLGFAGVIDNLRQGMTKLSSGQRKGALAEIFDVRGMRAADALISGTSGRFQEMADAIDASNGAAKEMADVRLRNLSGSLILAKSSAQAFWSALFNQNAQMGVAGVIGRTVDKINSLVYAMTAVSSGEADPLAKIKEQMTAAGSIGNLMAGVKAGAEGYLDPQKALSFAQGIFDGFKWFKDGVVGLGQTLRGVLDNLGLSKLGADGSQQFAKMATAGALLAAALGPVLLGVTALSFAGGGLFKMLGGGADVVGGLAGAFSLLSGTGGLDVLASKAKEIGGPKGALLATGINLGQLPKGLGGGLRRVAGGIGQSVAFGARPLVAVGGAVKNSGLGRAAGMAGGLAADLTEGFRGKLGVSLSAMKGGLGTFGSQLGVTMEFLLKEKLGGALGKMGTFLAPAFAPFTAMFSGLGPIFSAAFGPLAGLLAPILPIVGVLVGGFLLLRKEGESVGQTLSRIGGSVMGFITKAIASIPAVLGKLKEMVMPLIQGITAVAEPFAAVFQGIMGDLLGMAGGVLKPVFGAVFAILKAVFQVVGGVLRVIGSLLKPLAPIALALWGIVKPFVQMWLIPIKIAAFLGGKLAAVVGDLFTGLVGWVTKYTDKLAGVGKAIGDFILTPVRKVASLFADLLQAVAGFAMKKFGLDLSGSIRGLRELSGEWAKATGSGDIVPAMAGLPGAAVYGQMTQVDAASAFVAGASGGPKAWNAAIPAANAGEPQGMFSQEQVNYSNSQAGKAALRAIIEREAKAVNVTVNPPAVNPPDVNLTTETNVYTDSHEVAKAVERRKLEAGDRAGANTTPWQRRLSVVHVT